MAKQAKGMKSITNLSFETTYGIAPTAGKTYRVPFNKNGLAAKQNLIETNTITGRRDATEAGVGQLEASGQLELPLDVRNVGLVLKGMFGAPTSTAVTSGAGTPTPTGLYKHVFKVGDEIPSMTVEKGFPDINLFFQYLGVKCNKMSITAQVGNNETTYTVDTMAANEDEKTTTMAGTPDKLALTRFNNVNATVKEGGQVLGICRKMTLDMDNGLDGDTYCLNGKNSRPSINEGTMAVSGSIEALFVDDTLIKKGADIKETSLELIFTRDKFSLSFLIPELIFERTSPAIEGSAGVKVDLNYKGYYADDTNNSIIVVTLINDVASY